MFLMKWIDLTKDNLEYQWPLWGILKLQNFSFLKLDWTTVAQKFPELKGMLISLGSQCYKNSEIASLQNKALRLTEANR